MARAVRQVLRKTLKAALGNVEPTITANVPMVSIHKPQCM
jgi:hypothetical protein